MAMVSNEPEKAKLVAEEWLDFKMNPMVQMVEGDPDCDAVILARQYQRARDVLEWLNRRGGLGYDAHNYINRALGKEPIV